MNPDWDGIMKTQARKGVVQRVVLSSTNPLPVIAGAATRIQTLMEPDVVVTPAVIQEIRDLVVKIRALAGG